MIIIEIERFEFKCESGNLEFFVSDKTEDGELIFQRSIVYKQEEVDSIFKIFGTALEHSDSYIDKTKEILQAALLYTIGNDGSYGGKLDDWELIYRKNK